MKSITIYWQEGGHITFDDHEGESIMYHYVLKEIKDILINNDDYTFTIEIEYFEEDYDK